MIQKVDSLINAEDVLNRLMSNSATQEIDCLCECYQNGREQGFLLWGFKKVGKAIFFANSRNGDTIVVYVGKYSMQSVSEDAYRNSFHSKDNYEDVNYIIQQMEILNKE